MVRAARIQEIKKTRVVIRSARVKAKIGRCIAGRAAFGAEGPVFRVKI